MVKSGEGKSSFWSGTSAPIFPTGVALFPRNLISISAASQTTTSQRNRLLHRRLVSSTDQALQLVDNRRTKISSPNLRQPLVLYGCGKATVLAGSLDAYLYPRYSVFGYALGAGPGAVRPPVQRLCHQQSTSTTSPADAISTGKTLHH